MRFAWARPLDASRVRRLAGSVHQSLSNEITRKKPKKKPRAPFLPQKAKKKPNKTIVALQGVASAAEALLLRDALTGRRNLGVVILCQLPIG